jgi:GT2 family glycosyltransferase
MDDPAALSLTVDGPLAGAACGIHPVAIPAGDGLPLAAARNAGAAAALAAGADVLIFLDVDCVPAPALVDTYARSIATEPGSTLHCGVVRYLGPQIDASTIRSADLRGPAHSARPAPGPGVWIAATDWQLFWSLSFATSARTWRELGGFCEEYRGYGAEDTDLGYRAFSSGVGIRWVGGADAFHQYHPSEQPPVRHLHDIVRNATVFHRRWGFWPMTGWLAKFQELGLAEYDTERDRWSVTSPGAAASRQPL